MDKKEQRTEIKKRITQLTDSQCLEASEAIFTKLLQMKEYQEANCIFIYISVEKEVDTRRIIEHAWNQGKKIAIPKCIKKGIMDVHQITSWDDVQPGMYQIPEPKENCPKVPIEEIDFGIIPCVSCDSNKNRLGHGAGFYDRYLARGHFTTAALCMESLMLEEVCIDAHDQQVDHVITERGVY